MSDRFAVFADHFNKMGNSLAKVVESYNSGVSSFEQRILPTARKFKELGAIGRREIEKLTALEIRPKNAHPIEDEIPNLDSPIGQDS